MAPTGTRGGWRSLGALAHTAQGSHDPDQPV